MCVLQYVSRSRRGVIINLCIFFVVWLLTHATYMSLEVLQSSINANLGITTISILYATKAVSSLLGPFIVSRLSPKWTLVAGICLQMLYVAANYYPEWYTMYLAGALMGLAIAPMWVCFGLYTTVLGVYYANVTKQNKAAVLSKFNGFMGIATPLSIIFGNFITSLVFKYISFQDNDEPVDSNYTLLSSTSTSTEMSWTTTKVTDSNDSSFSLSDNQHEASVCNSHYCPQADFWTNASLSGRHGDDPHMPDQRVLYVLFTILQGVNLTALLLVIFLLDNIPREDIQSGGGPRAGKQAERSKVSCPVRVWCYIRAFFNLRYLLLVPSIAYFYMIVALLSSTFMKGYVSCTYGVGLIGLVSVTLGLSSVVVTGVGGMVGQCVHRNYLFLLALLFVLAALAIMALWDVMPKQQVMLHLVAGLLGAALGTNINQFAAFLGDTFTTTKTEVFSFYQFFSGITMAAGFFSTKYLCAMHQIFLLIGLIILSFVTYSFLSVQMYRNKRRDQALELPEIHVRGQTKPFLEGEQATT